MLFNLDPSLLIAATASFLAGLLGYVIARLWIKPIVGYNIEKRRLDREISRYLQRMGTVEESQTSAKDPEVQEILKAIRKSATNLAARNSTELPAWYRIFLVSREESSDKAMKLLSPLAKIKDHHQIQERVDQARKALRLS
ncbi:hypothetical protein DSCW_10030 [Desulfosarcina widdelii]|uniref:Uncharacterized protein n=1 Tax=Desulfosarcina widdelii TaxID=947919 RepID=A0A5K7YW83_9BACT|nr:hypothetical protein [Desulfosarcina widdelii]BBO73586.1 hypothetical protein DSCW_10030 [Desulfosarcina widdelii]